MTVRLRVKTSVQVSSQPQPETKDLGDVPQELVLDTQGEGGAWKTTVPATTVDMLVTLPAVALARFLYLKTRPKIDTDDPVPLSIKFDSTLNPSIIVEAPSPLKEGVFMITHPGIASLFVTNTGGVDMLLTLVVAGD